MPEVDARPRLPDHAEPPAPGSTVTNALSQNCGHLRSLLRRYDRPGPRYTSYPTAPHFRADFGPVDLEAHIAEGNEQQRPLSLYVHVPYCASPCFYCGCNRIITRDPVHGVRYAGRLQQEIRVLAPLFDRRREVVQLHFGGGTPNFLDLQALDCLVERLASGFSLSAAPTRDFSIELDPRAVTGHVREYADGLAALGFNRVSIGVQDFDAAVQHAVNRLQSTAATLGLLDACRASGFRSVNFDLIYGLPRQTLHGFGRTLRTVIAARPDRIAVYGYAHLPRLFKAQRQIVTAELPDAEVRLSLLTLAIEELMAAGYRYVGMDHFALPDDELVRAQDARRLRRNFMGYTTHAGCDLVGLGVSAISSIGDSYSQNHRAIKDWERAIDAGAPPLWRGLSLGADDQVRADVIGRLMCDGLVEFASVEANHGIRFGDYFASSLAALGELSADGLVTIDDERVTATPLGRLFLRNLAMCFDAYLTEEGAAAPMSRAV